MVDLLSFFAWCADSVLFCAAKAGSHTIGITERSEFSSEGVRNFVVNFFVYSSFLMLSVQGFEECTGYDAELEI